MPVLEESRVAPISEVRAVDSIEALHGACFTHQNRIVFERSLTADFDSVARAFGDYIEKRFGKTQMDLKVEQIKEIADEVIGYDKLALALMVRDAEMLASHCSEVFIRFLKGNYTNEGLTSFHEDGPTRYFCHYSGADMEHITRDNAEIVKEEELAMGVRLVEYAAKDASKVFTMPKGAIWKQAGTMSNYRLEHAPEMTPAIHRGRNGQCRAFLLANA
ncbi:MAG: hypothetical protein CMH32_05310 [Micavibrio sp.]|nr:hypothetical protein [Micavibrio sp.]HCK33211.1 hypothetical protein [Rhodospirillaceae bacterium]